MSEERHGRAAMISLFDGLTSLTERKIEIVRRLANGQSVQEIAIALMITADTVYEHLEVVRRKLRAGSLPEVVRLALLHGFISPDSS